MNRKSTMDGPRGSMRRRRRQKTLPGGPLSEQAPSETGAVAPDQPPPDELLDRVFRDPSMKQGLRVFASGERNKIKLRLTADDKVEIWCLKREKWLRARPEEVIRQMFLVWAQDTLKYPLNRILVEWPIQMGQDEEKERADIAIFTDDACTDAYIVFE